MYYLVKSEDFNLDHVISAVVSSYRQIEVGQLQRFRAAPGLTSLPTTKNGSANAFAMNRTSNDDGT